MNKFDRYYPAYRRNLFFGTPEPKVIRNPEMLVQYILVRTDIESMNIGRVSAQTGHAANKMVYDAEYWENIFIKEGSAYVGDFFNDFRRISEIKNSKEYVETNEPFFVNPRFSKNQRSMHYDDLEQLYENAQSEIAVWQNEAEGFGTAIVLDGGSEKNIIKTIEAAWDAGLIANVVIDPEYYVQDGQSGHIVNNVLTCGYIFGRKETCDPFTSNFNLLGRKPKNTD